MRATGKCVRCDKAIIVDEHGCLDEAMSGEISGGYGSRNDLCRFEAFICDDCAHVVAPVMTSDLGGEHKSCSREEYEAWITKHWDEHGNPREAVP